MKHLKFSCKFSKFLIINTFTNITVLYTLKCKSKGIITFHRGGLTVKHFCKLLNFENSEWPNPHYNFENLKLVNGIYIVKKTHIYSSKLIFNLCFMTI
jgi:hypothetical protein